MNTPRDILNYIFENNMDYAFICSMMKHVGGYSIAEITDGRFTENGGNYSFKSQSYNIDVNIQDDDIITAIINKMYISSFISRHNDSYQVHFMVHNYPAGMKKQFDEIIVKEVVQYMIMKTVIALRLDNFEKVKKYIGEGN